MLSGFDFFLSKVECVFDEFTHQEGFFWDLGVGQVFSILGDEQGFPGGPGDVVAEALAGFLVGLSPSSTVGEVFFFWW